MKILDKLTITHLKSNKKRTVVTIIGIMLSTALMVGIGLLFSTMMDNSIKMIEAENGTHHAIIEVPKDKLEVISDNSKVKEYKYSSSLGFALVTNSNEYKPYVEVLSVNGTYLKDLTLLTGNLPTNASEIVISNHLITDGGVKYKVGDKISLEIGTRVDSSNNIITDDNYAEGETLTSTFTKEYTIVGIVERSILESYSNVGYDIFTIDSDTKTLNTYITYKNIKDTYKDSNTIASNLGYTNLGDKENPNYSQVSYNDMLLSIQGVTLYSNFTDSLTMILCIILSLVAVACIIVIYNSFAISVMERKKQFGLFASIGATKKQLSYTVFFEALLVGLLGIILGILASFVGIGAVIMIINHLLLGVFGESLRLVAYPIYIIIPIIFMILTIFISAFLPAKRASKVSPIEAIRQNDDIKIKGKKIKSPKWILKIFGVEGDLAYKNMKRNKKKYRITIVSLFISIVLFISFSSIVKYGLESSVDYAGITDFEFYIQMSSSSKADIDNIEKEIKKYEHTDYTSYRYLYFNSDSITNASFTDSFKDSTVFDKTQTDYTMMGVDVVSLDIDSYNNYKKEIGLTSDQPVLLNGYETIAYTSNSRKQVKLIPFNNVTSINLQTYNYTDSKEMEVLSNYKLDNLYSTDTLPFGIMPSYPQSSLMVVVSDTQFNEIFKQGTETNNSLIIALNASNYTDLETYLEGLDNSNVSITHYNLKEQMKMIKNVILVVKILLYGFISLVTLIGITSVLNTINTSIALRRREFAMLRSMGLTPIGFNKILFLESLFFGLKSLLYAIPVSLGITYLLYKSINGVVEYDSMMIPYKSIFISIAGVFIIILISMWYSSRKMKHENILDAIREENI